MGEQPTLPADHESLAPSPPPHLPDQIPLQLPGPPRHGSGTNSSQTDTIQLALLDSVITDSRIQFDWDPIKSTSNQAKHGISLAEACTLWQGPVVTLPAKNPGEMRHLAIGLIAGIHWTVVYAPRDDHFRLISARRARTNEKALFADLVRPDHGGQP